MVPMIRFRLDCVFYYVRDLDRAIQFYSTVLGFPVSSRDAVARFDVDGLLFELVPASEPSVLSGSGNARLTLAVDDIRAASEQLRGRGVVVSDVRSVANGSLASFADPDGNELVLWQYQ